MVALAISEISWWIIDPSIGREVDTRSQNSPFSASAGQHLFTLSCQNPPPGGISDGYTQTSPGGCGAPSKKKKIAHHRHVLRYHLGPLCPCLSCGCSILLTLRPRFYISSSLLWPFSWLQQVTSHSTLFFTSRKSQNRNWVFCDCLLKSQNSKKILWKSKYKYTKLQLIKRSTF